MEREIIEDVLAKLGFNKSENLNDWQKRSSEQYVATVVTANIDHLDGVTIYCNEVNEWSATCVGELMKKLRAVWTRCSYVRQHAAIRRTASAGACTTKILL